MNGTRGIDATRFLALLFVVEALTFGNCFASENPGFVRLNDDIIRRITATGGTLAVRPSVMTAILRLTKSGLSKKPPSRTERYVVYTDGSHVRLTALHGAATLRRSSIAMSSPVRIGRERRFREVGFINVGEIIAYDIASDYVHGHPKMMDQKVDGRLTEILIHQIVDNAYQVSFFAAHTEPTDGDSCNKATTLKIELKGRVVREEERCRTFING